jgi:hypothetical protein
MIRAVFAALALLLAGTSFAHPAPNSVLRLTIQPDGIHAEYWVPVSELGHARAAEPGGEEFPTYLMRHFGFETPAGKPWRATLETVRQADYFDHAFLVAEIRLVPPRGASTREFVVVDDTVTHEVRNHVVYVVAKRGDQAERLGALQYPARRLTVAAR